MSSRRKWTEGSRLTRLLIAAPLAIFLLVVDLGCSKKELNDLVDKAKQLPGVAEEAVAEVLPESGNVSLTMSPPLEIQTASIEVISVGDGRPSVVQITTYDPAEGPKGGPHLLMHGTTTATNVSGLANQSVKCSLFLRTESAGTIARTSEGSPVDVTFQSVDSEEGTIRGTIDSVTLMGSDNSNVSISGGELLAVIKGGQ